MTDGEFCDLSAAIAFFTCAMIPTFRIGHVGARIGHICTLVHGKERVNDMRQMRSMGLTVIV